MLSAGEVIAAVNALRASQGLDEYSYDGGLAAYAQEHSEYMASIGTWTHTHSDGSTAGSRGYLENVATGQAGFLNAQNIVYQIWADAIHMKTMVGFAGGSAGVGIASKGGDIYVTLNVAPGAAVAQPNLNAPGGAGFTPIALVPLATVTPKVNGAIVHEVGFGQSLWAIAVAYGVTGNRIRELNGMAADDVMIYDGQKLLIVPAGTITPQSEAMLATATPDKPKLARITMGPRPTSTRAQALTATPRPAALAAARVKIDPVMVGLIGMAALGLILFLSSSVKITRKNRG
jgi:LysM repeat protein